MRRRKTRKYRTEHDLLGEMKIPADAYWGVQTERAIGNFRISGQHISAYPDLIQGLAMVKQAAARANHECGALDEKVANAIVAACQDVIDGRFHDQFKVDVFQGGAGTSTNMNANEVIANRALEHLSKEKGDYESCDPHDHVNLSQSTNDAYPTALHIALALGNTTLIKRLNKLVEEFHGKSSECGNVVKMVRTHLQDAVPMTLGQ